MVIEASLTVFLGILHELDYTDQETPRLFYTPVDTILDPGELLHLLPSSSNINLVLPSSISRQDLINIFSILHNMTTEVLGLLPTRSAAYRSPLWYEMVLIRTTLLLSASLLDSVFLDSAALAENSSSTLQVSINEIMLLFDLSSDVQERYVLSAYLSVFNMDNEVIDNLSLKSLRHTTKGLSNEDWSLPAFLNEAPLDYISDIYGFSGPCIFEIKGPGINYCLRYNFHSGDMCIDNWTGFIFDLNLLALLVLSLTFYT